MTEEKQETDIKCYAQYICAVPEQRIKLPKTLRPFVGLYNMIELTGDQITPALVDALVQMVKNGTMYNLYLTPFLPTANPAYNDPSRYRMASQFVHTEYTHGCGAVIFNQEKSIAFYRRLDQYLLNKPVYLQAGDESPAHPPCVFETPQAAGEALRNLILAGSLEKSTAPNPDPVAGQQKADPSLLYWLGASLGHIPQQPEELEQIRELDASRYALGYPVFPDWLIPEPGNWSLLGSLPNLESLFMPELRLEDYSFLLCCPSLTRLDLSNTNLRDGSVLKNLPKLTYLSLPASEFQDFSFLLDCPELEILDLSRTNFRDCALLAQMPRLKLVTLPARRQLLHMEVLERLYLQVKIKEDRVRGEGGSPFALMEPSAVEEGWQDRRPPYKVLYISQNGKTWEGAEITSDCVKKLVKKIARGDVGELYLSLNPYGEEDFMEVDVAKGWAALSYEDTEARGWYAIYNAEYAGVEEDAPPLGGGQSPIPKMHAIQDLELAAVCVEYFIKQGKLYPGAPWAKYYG